MSAEQQIEALTHYIMSTVPDELSRDEGAGDVAVRLLSRYRGALNRIMDKIGPPVTGFPATAKEDAYVIAKDAILGRGASLETQT